MLLRLITALCMLCPHTFGSPECTVGEQRCVEIAQTHLESTTRNHSHAKVINLGICSILLLTAPARRCALSYRHNCWWVISAGWLPGFGNLCGASAFDRRMDEGWGHNDRMFLPTLMLATGRTMRFAHCSAWPLGQSSQTPSWS